MSSHDKPVTIFTDGACQGNPGPGGYGTVLLCEGHRKELSGGYRKTTNNRMELMAAIAGLRALKRRCRVSVHSDSKYLVDAMTKNWTRRWRSNGWQTRSNDAVQNIDLWMHLIELCEQHEVTFIWVRGHAGVAENETCDRLAVAAAARTDLPPDIPYETPPTPGAQLLL